uniref:Uncharacterized protein n=1 Tax=Setaria italica TaxID=4555 RepID=K3YN20_SETIT
MPVAVRNVAVAPLAAHGCLALICAGFLWLLNTWLFSAGVATAVTARFACGAGCPAVLVLAAVSLAATALALAIASTIAMFLLSHCVMDAGARAQMAAVTREALDGGSIVVFLGRLAFAAFVSLGILAFVVKVCPSLRRWERISSVALDAAALCASALCCFVFIPTFAIRMWRRL